MTTNNGWEPISPELAAISSALDELATRERLSAPASLESRLLLASRPALRARPMPAGRESGAVAGPIGLWRAWLGRPMRLAAAFVVLVGGAVMLAQFSSIGGHRGGPAGMLDVVAIHDELGDWDTALVGERIDWLRQEIDLLDADMVGGGSSWSDEAIQAGGAV